VPEAIGAAGSLAVSSIGDEGGSDLVVTAGALTAADDSVASSGETAAGTGGPSSITVDAMGASVAESSLSGMATHDLTGVDVAGPGGMATVAMAAEDATSALYSTAEPTHELVSGAATMASDVAATADRSAMAADAAQAGSAVHAPEITISHDMAESSSVAPDATADEHAGLDAAAVAGTGVADESVGMGDSLVSAGGVAGVAAEMVGAPDAATSSAVPTMDAAPTGAAAASIDSLAEPISAGAPSVPDLEGSVGAYEDGKTNMSPYLDKAYEAWELGALLDAPVDALEGVSRSDAELLQRAFNIRTIRDMGANRYFRRAKSIVALAHPSDTHEGH